MKKNIPKSKTSASKIQPKKQINSKIEKNININLKKGRSPSPQQTQKKKKK